jgi:heptosyltransferase-2
MKILAVQNRMGIGDTVIFLPFIETISRKFNTPVSLLVKKSSKADQYIKQTDYLDKLIFLERNNKKNERHNGIIGSIRLAKELKKNEFDKIFIFNSSLRFNLIARMANIKEIYQYPLFKKTNQHIVQPAKDLIKKNLGVDVVQRPSNWS